MENPFSLSDTKLKELLKSYALWYKKNEIDLRYSNTQRQKSQEIKETLLNKNYLSQASDEELAKEIFDYSRKLEGPAHIRLGMPRIKGRLSLIKRNLLYIIDPSGDPFKKAAEILEGKLRIELFYLAFWTPILQAQYPNVLPNWNNKTSNFLKKVGIDVKTSRLSAEEKYRKISEAFLYLLQLDTQQDFYTLNHLMHYGTVIFEGVQVLDGLLGIKKVPKSKEKIVTALESVETTNHSEAEFTLLKLGQILGYDTYSPDRNKIAYGKKLEDLISLDDIPQFTTPSLLDTIKYIDVIWFQDEFPICCFEIEHTTGVTKGLLRLYQTSQLNTKLFVIAPADVLKKFEKELQKMPFRKIKHRYIFRSYEDLASFCSIAENYVNLKKRFFKED